jgi:hypothetical protein
MKPSKNSTEFAKWLEKSALSGVLHHGGVRLEHIDRIQTEIFIANTKDEEPICIFEVGNGGFFNSKNHKYLLRKLPAWSLKLPGYTILYQKKGYGSNEIIKFNVRKFTPTERFVGEFSPREFAGFLVSTVNFCRKKYEKENS